MNGQRCLSQNLAFNSKFNFKKPRVLEKETNVLFFTTIIVQYTNNIKDRSGCLWGVHTNLCFNVYQYVNHSSLSPPRDIHPPIVSNSKGYWKIKKESKINNIQNFSLQLSIRPLFLAICITLGSKILADRRGLRILPRIDLTVKTM